jgi:hypothetical protein
VHWVRSELVGVAEPVEDAAANSVPVPVPAGAVYRWLMREAHRGGRADRLMSFAVSNGTDTQGPKKLERIGNRSNFKFRLVVLCLDKLAVSGEVNQMIAAAINANPQSFWHRPDA